MSDESEKCYFDNEKINACIALTHKKCEGCKFRKSEAEYFDGLQKARKLLEAKGLKTKYVDMPDGTRIVTTV